MATEDGQSDGERFENIIGQQDGLQATAGLEQDMGIREGLTGLFRRLEDEVAGIAVVNEWPDKINNPTAAEQERLAYILPTSIDERGHLVVFQDGDLWQIGPANDEPSTLANYDSILAPNTIPLGLAHHRIPSLLEAKRQFAENLGATMQVLCRPDSDDSLNTLKGLVHKAYNTKEQRILQNNLRRQAGAHVLRVFGHEGAPKAPPKPPAQ